MTQLREWRVMVVDDNEAFGSLVRDGLESRGFGVCVARCADEAREEMKKCAVGFVLMDVDMPGMGGLTLASEFRKESPWLPVVFMTAGEAEHGRLDEHERVDKASPDFYREVVPRIREEMDRYTARCDRIETLRLVRDVGGRVDGVAERVDQMATRIDTVETLTGEHSRAIRAQAKSNGRLATVKQVIIAIGGVAVPVLVYLANVSQDVTKDTLHELTEIKPMRVQLERLVKDYDADRAGRVLDRQERLVALGVQRVQATQLEKIVKTLPSVVPSPATTRTEN